MGPLSRETWAQRLGAFRASPSAFMAGPEGEDLGRDLLSDLRSEKLSEQTKVSLLALSLEYPAQLWPDAPAAEAAATFLLDTLDSLPPRPSALRRPLLLAATTTLVAGDVLGPTSGASLRLLPLLLGLAASGDLGPRLGPSWEQRSLQATACECLRELESCKPGLLGGCLGLLRSLLGQEGPVGQVQPLSLLLALALRNSLVIQAKARARASGQGLFTARVSPTGSGPWDWTLAEEGDAHLQPQAPSWPAAEEEGGLSALEPSPEEARELRAAVAQLLDTSYLLTPVAQAQLLWLLGWALRGLRGQPPVLFKPQLVRLLGTAQLTLLHAVLALKAAFGEALFTAQDEALLLRRLTVAAQHPALPLPAQLFYLHCLLSFPENCPLGPAGEEAAPLLLEPQLCCGLLPSLQHDPMALLARLHLLCLLCAEDGDEEEKGQGQGPRRYLEELLAGLWQRAALSGGPRALATLCFQASYLVARCLSGQPAALAPLTHGLAQLYRARPALAPHFVDLLDQVGSELGEPLRVVLRQDLVSRSGKDEALRWHLQMLAKVADQDAQPETLRFLQAAAAYCTDWGLQQALLQESTCGPRNLPRFLLPHRQSNALHGPQGHRVPTPSPGASPQEAAGAAVSSAGWRMTTEGQALLCWGKSLCCCPCLLGSPPSGSPGPVLSLLMGALGEERARDRWGGGRSGGLPQARAPAIICCVIWASRRQPHQEGFGSRKRKLLQLFAAERDLR
ncbi:AP-5 complex subunit beta-1 isoform X2 [Rousettus aegyptiacus]|uniref:AP-5 complex subunit beta-1 isoform X2 n=1 Tax=Rousettus aegyptiacus TaxID=9407 RepID=UPI00168D30AB|nr:AP-5 complex subunit beta-1 isoform X2 [Rousettus aegyptiacus]